MAEGRLQPKRSPPAPGHCPAAADHARYDPFPTGGACCRPVRATCLMGSRCRGERTRHQARRWAATGRCCQDHNSCRKIGLPAVAGRANAPRRISLSSLREREQQYIEESWLLTDSFSGQPASTDREGCQPGRISGSPRQCLGFVRRHQDRGRRPHRHRCPCRVRGGGWDSSRLARSPTEQALPSTGSARCFVRSYDIAAAIETTTSARDGYASSSGAPYGD